MSRLPSEVKIPDSTTKRNGDIVTAIGLPDTNPGIAVLVLRKCNVRSMFRQFKGKPIIVLGGPPDSTTLFDKVEFFYLVGNLPVAVGQEILVLQDHNYTRPIFSECG